MHLADAFIQCNSECIQGYILKCVFPINQTHNLGVAGALYYQLIFMKFAEWFVSAHMQQY